MTSAPATRSAPPPMGAALAVLLLAGLGQAAGAPAASAASGDCPARKGTLAKVSDARVWHRGTSLYACTTAYGVAPKARRMGPWTPRTRVAFDGRNVAWSTQTTRGGAVVDRLWAGDALRGKRWMGGRQALPAATAGGARAEGTVVRIRVADGVVGWMARGGTVVMAARSGAADPVRVGGGALAGPLDGDYLRVEQVDPGAALSLASALKLTVGQGEGDECGGGAPYALSVPSGPGGERRGARWDASYTGSPACD